MWSNVLLRIQPEYESQDYLYFHSKSPSYAPLPAPVRGYTLVMYVYTRHAHLTGRQKPSILETARDRHMPYRPTCSWIKISTRWRYTQTLGG